MKISLIVAMAENRVIGRQGQLPWHLPEDLKRFKQLTIGHPIVMGRKTYESIGKLLPGRENIILTRQKNFQIAGATVFESLEAAISILKKRTPPIEEIFIIGGGEIYHQALPIADRIYLTQVHQTVDGDTRFPEIPVSEFKLVQSEPHPEFTFQVFSRA